MPNTVDEARSFFMLGTPRHVKYTPDMNAMKAFFMLGDITVTARAVEVRGERAKAMLYGMVDKFTYELAQAMLWVDANCLAIEDSVVDPTPKDVASFKPSEPQLAAFNTLWRTLLGPKIGDIWLTCLQVAKKFPAWKVEFDPWVQKADFYELYFHYLEALREISKIGNHVFKLERPEGAEGMAGNPNLVLPYQIRFFRK
jgi:hypothetical protein